MLASGGEQLKISTSVYDADNKWFIILIFVELFRAYMQSVCSYFGYLETYIFDFLFFFYSWSGVHSETHYCIYYIYEQTNDLLQIRFKLRLNV